MTAPRRHRAQVAASALLVFVAASALAACGQSQSATTPAKSSEPLSHSVNTPSESTRMICEPEAQKDLAATLGVKTVTPPTPIWLMHTYTCQYAYSDGHFTLSVKQLPDATQTRDYFTSLGDRLTRRMPLTGLGQGAFTTADGSVIVQKDDKILLVDVHGLPTRFGVPSDTRANAAISIAATIMGCWTGA